MKNYILLPFNFKNFPDNKVLMVNAAGEFIIIESQDFNDFCNQSLNENTKVYQLLEGRHFLTSKENLDLTLDMLAVKLRTRKQFISSFTTLHMLVVTLRCNCACKYCHASSTDYDKYEYDMTWDTAKKSIDMIFCSKSPEIKIEFQGGEPTLNWKVIEQAVLYSEFLNRFAKKYLSFVICTNLLQVSEDIIEFCKSHKIEISSSLDGPRCLHDSCRVSKVSNSAYDDFVKNAEIIKEKIESNAVAPLLTITRKNIFRLREIIDEYIRQGYKSIFLRALNPYGNASQNLDVLGYSSQEYISAYIDALDYIVQLNKNGVKFAEDFASLLLSRILTPYSTGFVDLQSPSGAGISGAIYNYDGKVYPADEARMLARMGDDHFYMGSIDDNYQDVFYGDMIRDIVFNSCVECMTICSECVYQQYCGADTIRNYYESKNLLGDRRNNTFCEKNKAIFDYLFRLLASEDEETIGVFWSWINRSLD